MKTSHSKIIVTGLFMVTLTALGFQSKADGKKNYNAEIKEISASGNVHVYIQTGETESIKIDGDCDKRATKLELEDGTLSITSTEYNRVNILVTVTSLDHIAAYGNAFIQTLSDLKLDTDNIYLNDSSFALIKTGDTETFLSKND